MPPEMALLDSESTEDTVAQTEQESWIDETKSIQTEPVKIAHYFGKTPLFDDILPSKSKLSKLCKMDI